MGDEMDEKRNVPALMGRESEGEKLSSDGGRKENRRKAKRFPSDGVGTEWAESEAVSF